MTVSFFSSDITLQKALSDHENLFNKTLMGNDQYLSTTD